MRRWPRRTLVPLLLGAALVAEPVGSPLRGRPAAAQDRRGEALLPRDDATPEPAPAALTPQQERGRQLYVECTSPSGGEIVAVLGEGLEVEASAVPCASCHGRDGKGRPEGGVTPTDITWISLTKPYGVTHASGRHHPPYDEKLLKRAVAMGFDPAGNELNAAMPRYRMSAQDMADLTAYLRTLGRTGAPGVDDTALRIGALLPPPGALSAMAAAVRAALTARFAAANAAGGIYGRRLELRFLDLPAAAGDRRAAAARFLETENVFAVVGAFLAGADDELAALFQEKQVPLVGPFTLHPREELPLNRYVFYLLPGLEAQAQALARFARDRLTAAAARPAIVAPAEAGVDAAVAALGKACEGWAPATVVRYGREPFAPGELAGKLAAAKADPVFFLGSGAEAAALLRAAAPGDWRPRLLATASAADGSLFAAPAVFDGRLYLALPAEPEPGPQAAARYRALGSLPAEHLSAQLTALAAAEILIEGLTRAGRDLTRESFVETLEGLNRFETGYAPPITYGPGRRLGARGAYVFAVDLAGRRLAPSGSWFDAN
jgi:ABC-type branched-subunit amino acid transport system substrate-binding protein